MSVAAGPVPVIESQAESGQPLRLSLQQLLMYFLGLFALSGLALLGPLLDSLQRGATFFVAQGMQRNAIFLFLAFWAVVPPIVLAIPVAIAGFFSKRIADLFMAVISGVLAAFTLLGFVSASHTWRGIVFLPVLLVLAGAFGVLYLKFRNLRFFVAVLAIAPVMTIVVFVSSPEMSGILAGPETGAAIARDETPIVMVIFDEFSLGTMVKPDGSLNSSLFPGFAGLASTATWYPEAKSLAPWTNLSVPSIDSGKLPDSKKVPAAAAWPHTIFTMFGDGVGQVSAHESTTALCPESICGATSRLEWNRVFADSWSVVGNSVLPSGLAARFFSSLGDTWAGFSAEDASLGSRDDLSAREFAKLWKETVGESNDPPVVADEIVSGVADMDAGDLDYAHISLPHAPYEFLPDGIRYNGTVTPSWFSDNRTELGTDPWGQVSLRQRLLLQSMEADSILTRILDSLRASGRFDEAMVIVTSDHGITLEPGAHRRSARKVTANTTDDVVAVPLFVKYPGQKSSIIDRRDARLIDVLPTVADVVEAQLPEDWKFDGSSLLRPEVNGRPLWWFAAEGEVLTAPDPARTASRNWQWLGATAMETNPYAIGPFAGLVGQSMTKQRISADSPGTCTRSKSDLAAWDPASGVLPALVSASIGALPSGTWIAAEVNGEIAGVAPVFTSYKGKPTLNLVIMPSVVQPGSNVSSLHVVNEDGTLSSLTCSG
jgi:hypothetical protein